VIASTVPAALAGLMALVKAQVATDPLASKILVYYGEPGMDEPDDIILIGKNVHRTVDPRVLLGGYGQGALQETYEIVCEASTWSGSEDPLAAITRAYELAAYIESAVRTDPTLGTSVLEAHPAGSSDGDPEWTADPVGRLCTLSVLIAVTTLN
jgi:hypothetical protein